MPSGVGRHQVDDADHGGRGCVLPLLRGGAAANHSAATGAATRRRAPGAENFLAKPVDVEHLAAVADRALEKVELRRVNRSLVERLAGERAEATLGDSPRMRDLARQVELLASSDQTGALLLGESGTGKSWVAQMIHDLGTRSKRSYVEINCAGLSATFLDSELFGHEKGAYTDAKSMKRALFEVADGGTIFLDEIGELIPELQPKLLHVLETRSFRRLGGTQEIGVDVRVIAATNKDLEAEVRAGRFREDLFYRLSVFPLQIPPLRERSADDGLELAHRLLGDVRKRNPRAPAHFSPAALDLLTSHPWPGNVRELRNALQRAVVLAGDGTELRPEHFPALRGGASEISRAGDAVALPLAELERQHIGRALFLLDGNRTHTAQRLGISRATLHAKIKQHRLEEIGRG